MDHRLTVMTPSARSAFEAMKRDYETALLDKAFEIANQSRTSEVEVSLRDVLEARNRIGKTGGISPYSARKERLAISGLFAGFSYAFLGVIMFWATNAPIGLDYLVSVKGLWVWIVVAGMALMLLPLKINFSRIMTNRSQYGEDGYERYISPNTVVKLWAIIEEKGKELMNLRGIDSENDSLGKTVYDFLAHELNSREFIDMINEVIMMRNQIVHSEDVDFKKEDIAHVLNISQRIVDELDNRIKQLSN